MFPGLKYFKEEDKAESKLNLGKCSAFFFFFLKKKYYYVGMFGWLYFFIFVLFRATLAYGSSRARG